jgi:hypothetical protein
VTLNIALFSLKRVTHIQIILYGPAWQPPDVKPQARTFIPAVRAIPSDVFNLK